MKRLAAHGSGNIFQICHCFRREEAGRYHQEEFTMLEWYRTGGTYHDLMDECEMLVCELTGSGSFTGTTAETIKRGGREVSLARPWDRLTVDEAFQAHAGMSVGEALQRGLFDELLVSRVEPHLGLERPVFLYDYPAELASLARLKEGDESLAERFELYIAGIEMVNGFSELVDPDRQRQRFVREIAMARDHGWKDHVVPEKFLLDLELLEETAGAALGFDRLFMVLLGLDSVPEAVCFNDEDL
jgi:lysyl-tRNA synthetase class 2